MFVGHYGAGFASKALKKSIPLWHLFLAVQLVDIFWALFILLGIEKVRITPGITTTNPLDLYYMPYTHSLVAAVLWSLAAAIGYRVFVRKGDGTTAGLVGLAVLSHWILDLLVHRPDLPLYDNAHKIGLGLWNWPGMAFVMEGGLLFIGIYLYLRASPPTQHRARIGTIIFGIVMLAFHSLAFFGPPPPSDKVAALTSLTFYFGFAGVAWWIERT